MSKQGLTQKKPVSNSYSPPAQKPATWQRPFSDPVHDATVSPKQYEAINPSAGFNLMQMKIFPDAPAPVQAKSTVSTPGDDRERQADIMASQVMKMSVPENEEPIQQQTALEENKEQQLQTKPLATAITPLVQREITPEQSQAEEELPVQAKAESEGKSSNNGNLESQLNGSKGGGSPLPDEVRAFMEPRFGADFSGVRVHTDATAVQMNKELGAQAFAHGSDIYYGAGKSPGKDELTAHEMTHVLQQTGGAPLGSKLANQQNPITTTNSQDGEIQRYPDTSFEIVRMGLAQAALELGINQVIEKKKTKNDLLNEAFWMAYPEMNGNKISDVSDAEQKQTYIDAYLHIANSLYPKVYKQAKRTAEPKSDDRNPIDDIVNGVGSIWENAQNAWNQVQEWVGGPKVFLVHDPDAQIRTPPPELKSTGESIPQDSQVKILETLVKNDKEFVRVQEVVEGAESEGKIWGWTAASNLSSAKKTSEDIGKIKPEDFEDLTSFEEGNDDITSEILESISEDLAEVGESPETWFNNFVDITFLGKTMKHPVHRVLAAHLKNVEAKFVSETGAKDAKEAAKKLGLTETFVAAGRTPEEEGSSTSMHVFGLAVDVDVTHNPWIAIPNQKADKTEEGGQEKWANTYYGYMQELLGGERLEFKRDFNLGKVDGVNLDDRLTATIENVFKIDKMVESYFSLLAPENEPKLQELLSKATSARWKGKTTEEARTQIQEDLNNCGKIWYGKRWKTKNEQLKEMIPENGITNLSEEVIRGMELYWGGMFGDLMHFDLRDRGIGSKVYQAALKYKKGQKKEKKE